MDENKTQIPNYQDPNIKVLRTYTSDMADVMRENEISVIKIALAEQQKREREDIYKKAEGTSVSKFFLMVGGVIFIMLGIYGAYYFYKKASAPKAPIQINKEVQMFIPYEDKSVVDVTNATNSIDISNIIKEEVGRIGKAGSIRSFFLTVKQGENIELIPIKSLLSILESSAPSSLIRNLTDSYMIGTYTPRPDGNTAHLFIILQTNDYNLTYAGLLDWEKSMLRDMFGLFQIDVSGDRSELFEKPWKDIIINNRDARILYDKIGNDVLYYVFVSKDKFVITDNKEAIKEISARLLIQNIKPL